MTPFMPSVPSITGNMKMCDFQLDCSFFTFEIYVVQILERQSVILKLSSLSKQMLFIN
jgi:hypothetical protein